MRIGEFAGHYNLTIDTIRHYMDMGLIVPMKKGSLYEFDEKCHKDMALVGDMKKLGFKIREMRKFFYYKRMYTVDSVDTYDFYMRMLDDKKKEHLDEIKQRNDSLNAINNLTSILRKGKDALSDKKVMPIGVPLQALNSMACPKCHGALSLNSDELFNNQIINGTLSCACGNSYIINNGVLLDEQTHAYHEPYEPVQVKSILHDYLTKMTPDFFDIHYKIIKWATSLLEITPDKPQLILECGSYFGYIMRSVIEDIHDDSIYFCVEPNHAMFYGIKEITESMGLNKKVVFVSMAWENLPLKKESIDCMIDSNATLNYFFCNADAPENENILTTYCSLLKENAVYAGYYLFYSKFSPIHEHVPPSVRHRFKRPYVDNIFASLPVIDVNEKTFSRLSEESEYEMYYREGDVVAPTLFVKRKV